MSRHWGSLSVTFPAPPPHQDKMTPYIIWWGIFTHKCWTHTLVYAQIHIATHILSWSDDIIKNHYWDTRKCWDLRLRVWLHGIKLASFRWKIWKEKHHPKLFNFWISSMLSCLKKPPLDGKSQFASSHCVVSVCDSSLLCFQRKYSGKQSIFFSVCNYKTC